MRQVNGTSVGSHLRLAWRRFHQRIDHAMSTARSDNCVCVSVCVCVCVCVCLCV